MLIHLSKRKLKMINKDEQLNRHQICQACDKFNKEEYRCGICKCFLQYKIPLATSQCPIGRWKQENIKKSDILDAEIEDE